MVTARIPATRGGQLRGLLDRQAQTGDVARGREDRSDEEDVVPLDGTYDGWYEPMVIEAVTVIIALIGAKVFTQETNASQ